MGGGRKVKQLGRKSCRGGGMGKYGGGNFSVGRGGNIGSCGAAKVGGGGGIVGGGSFDL